MTRPGDCPVAGGEPCQAMCLDGCTLRRPRENVGAHPYVRTLKGCHHGKLFTEPCTECEIVGLREEYTNAIRTLARVRDRMRVLGVDAGGRIAP